MKKKHIILIRNAKSYDFGGGERFPVLLADILTHNGLRTTVVSRSPKLLSFAADHSIKTVRGWWWSHQDWSGVKALLFPIYVLWQLALFIWYLQLFLRLKPTAVHVQSKDDFIAATFAGKLVGSRVIWTDHADLKHIWRSLHIWYKNPVGKLVHFAAHFANAITVVSESERTLVTKRLRDSSVISKIRTVYNGISDSLKEHPAHTSKDSFVFCVASRLVPDKGINEVITAFDRLHKEYPATELWLMGDGRHAASFKQKAGHNKAIIFLGHQERPLEYIARSHVFVHPTYHEGFSVALVEASMLAKPIIATAVGGNIEIIHDNETGLLVAPKDPVSLYDAMKRLYDDPSLCTKLGKQARKQYEEQFNFDEIAKKTFIPLYDEVVS